MTTRSIPDLAAWAIRAGLREHFTELVPALLLLKSEDDLDHLTQEMIAPLQEKLSKKAFTALSKKCAVTSPQKKKKQKPLEVDLPARCELTESDQNVVIFINRSPVLQLWTTCCCKVMGYSDVESLAMAGAYVRDMSERKKKILGLSVERSEAATVAAATADAHEAQTVHIMGFDVQIPKEDDHLRVAADKSLRYMKNAYEADFIKFFSAMSDRANAIGKDPLEGPIGYDEYERFRPPTSGGPKGFGEKGRFHLKSIKGS